jgi:hypothetical protein
MKNIAERPDIGASSDIARAWGDAHAWEPKAEAGGRVPRGFSRGPRGAANPCRLMPEVPLILGGLGGTEFPRSMPKAAKPSSFGGA